MSFGVDHSQILDSQYWNYIYKCMDDSSAHVGVTKSLKKKMVYIEHIKQTI